MAFADTGTGAEEEKSKTITELNSNIQTLEEEKDTLDYRWDFFRKQHGGLSAFIREELTDEESESLEQLSYIYNSKKKELDIRLVEELKELQETKEIKLELIELKKQFYKDLTTFVTPAELPEFLEYIKGDIELNERNKEVKEELYKEKIELKEKVDTLKEKIEEHKEVLDDRIKKLIREKLVEKLSEVKTNPRYIELSLANKILFFEKALEKTRVKKSALEGIENKTGIIQKKIELYRIIEKALEEEVNYLD